MPFIPRQVKPPARLAISCRVPQEVATLLKHYAEFLESSQEYVVAETLCLAFRRDKEFHTWLATTHPEMRVTTRESLTTPADRPRPARGAGPATAASARRSPTPSDPLSNLADTETLVRGERARA
jgi:hypothetical protein